MQKKALSAWNALKHAWKMPFYTENALKRTKIRLKNTFLHWKCTKMHWNALKLGLFTLKTIKSTNFTLKMTKNTLFTLRNIESYKNKPIFCFLAQNTSRALLRIPLKSPVCPIPQKKFLFSHFWIQIQFTLQIQNYPKTRYFFKQRLCHSSVKACFYSLFKHFLLLFTLFLL